MNSRPGGTSTTVFLCLVFLLGASPVFAQTIRYVGRAVAEIVTDQSGGSEAHAGGGPEDDSIFCDQSVDCCFDQPNGCSQAPNTLASRTRGGTGETVDATPFFPRVNSRSGVVSIDLGGNLVSLSGVQAIADADGDADNDGAPDDANNDGVPDPGLETSCGVVTVTAGEEVTEVIPELNIEVPVTESSVARCTRTEVNEDGFSSVEVDVVILEPQPGGTQFLHANSVAGVEVPFTTGGGGGGCAIRASRRGPDVGLFGLFALLWLASRRRRKPGG